jgi:hypothetical protein
VVITFRKLKQVIDKFEKVVNMLVILYEYQNEKNERKDENY